MKESFLFKYQTLYRNIFYTGEHCMCIWITKERFRENGIDVYKTVHVYTVKLSSVVETGNRLRSLQKEK